jgi:type I restriction enzyme S subunit
VSKAKEWERVRLGDALKLVNGRAFKPSEWKKSGLPIVRIQNLNNPDAPFNYCDDKLPEKFLLNTGDLLFAWSGTPGTSFGAHIWRQGKAWLNQHIFKVVFDEKEFDKRFLQLAINQNLNDYIRQAHGGAGLAHITKGKFENSELPKPPLSLQEEIVAEIEKQSSRLDEAVAGLKRIQANLKRYKSAVLKAAVEGKLTEKWRKEHPDVEPADQLLKRILAERRAKWETEELAKMKAKGIKPKDDSWKKKYKEPAGPDTTNLPALPEEWVWATLPQLGELNRGKSKHRPRNAPHLYGGKYPFVQTGDIRAANGLLRDFSQTYSEAGLEQSRLWPSGTLCITIAANIADTAILGIDACFPDSVVGFLTGQNHCEVRFVEFFIRTAKEDIERYAPATAQKNINLEILAEIAVVLPPLKEQKTILEEIDRRLSVTEELEATIEINLKRAERLRQRILHSAFSGDLLSEV